MDLKDVVIQIISLQPFQETITVYPVLKDNKTYIINGETKRNGKEIMDDGIESPIPGWHEMIEIKIKEIDGGRNAMQRG